MSDANAMLAAARDVREAAADVQRRGATCGVGGAHERDGGLVSNEAAREHAALACERTGLAVFNLAKAMKAAAAGDWDEWSRRMAAVECLSVGAHREFARVAEASRHAPVPAVEQGDPTAS